MRILPPLALTMKCSLAPKIALLRHLLECALEISYYFVLVGQELN